MNSTKRLAGFVASGLAATLGMARKRLPERQTMMQWAGPAMSSAVRRSMRILSEGTTPNSKRYLDHDEIQT
jgi:hypothetical protein